MEKIYGGFNDWIREIIKVNFYIIMGIYFMVFFIGFFFGVLLFRS